MDDDKNEPRRGRDGKPFRRREGGGQRTEGGARREGRGGKPFTKPRGDKPFAKSEGYKAKKPYAPRAWAADAGDQDARSSRPAKPRFGGEKRFGKDGPERSGPKRFDRDRSTDRPREGFKKRPRPDTGGEDGGSGERFARRPRPESGDEAAAGAPRERFSKGPRRDGDRPDRPRKPFDSDRPRKPFDKSRPKFDKPRPGRDADDGEAAVQAEPERIAKRLARAGIASRRDAEALIAAGRIKVNGKVLDSPAFNVTEKDRIELDSEEIPPVERTRLFLFHKPAGVVTTNRDPEGRRTVFDVLPADLPRLMTIGRLDINTEGLLLLTNDGGLSRLLELPSTGWLRRYRVRVHGKVEEKALADLKDGIAVDGVFYGSIEASLDREQGTNAWLTLGLREGKNREVRNILGALGLEVSRLIRVSYGPFQLGELKEGEVQEIRGRTLRDQLGERLIEEAGANFEAPVTKPFSRYPERRRDEDRDERPARPKIRRDGERGRIGEGGLIKKRRRPDDAREEALGKLSTRPERGSRPAGGVFGDKPRFPNKGAGGKFGKREEAPQQRGRTSNVWMAPGARPQSENAKASKPSSSRGEEKGEGRTRSPRGPGDSRGPSGKPKRGPRKP